MWATMFWCGAVYRELLRIIWLYQPVRMLCQLANVLLLAKSPHVSLSLCVCLCMIDNSTNERNVGHYWLCLYVILLTQYIVCFIIKQKNKVCDHTMAWYFGYRQRGKSFNKYHTITTGNLNRKLQSTNVFWCKKKFASELMNYESVINRE